MHLILTLFLLQRERSLSRLRSEQRGLGVDIDSDEEGNYWDESLDQGIQHPPLKKVRTNEEGQVRSSSTTPRNRLGVKNDKVCLPILTLLPLHTLSLY